MFEKTEIDKGISLYLYPTNKFKAITITLFIHLPLDERATQNALLMRVLSRGCSKYPNRRKIVRFLESLYGAGFGVDVDKIGERHILEITFHLLSERFIPAPRARTNLKKGFQFLKKIISQPLLEDNGFNRDYFKQEQTNLKNLIEGLIDDKFGYAQERCISEMCRDEPYRIYEYGRVEDIPKIEPVGLLNYLYTVLARSQIDIFIIGDIEPVRITRLMEDVFSNLSKSDRSRAELIPIPPTIVDKPVREERLVKETQSIEQGKLVLGYRTYTSWSDEDIFALMVFNGVLGGFSHSKLFREVRENAGLAYYAHSGLDKAKGLMFVNVGINPDKFDRTVPLIKKQIDAIREGNITELEFEGTQKCFYDRLKAIEDSSFGLINDALERSINRRTESLKAIRERLRHVSRADVIRVAEKVKLDTIYFLSP